MTQYIGTKIINAKPMNRQKYNDFRNWTLPEDENGADEGYLVEYLDGGQANTEEFSGYVSWSPKEVFERSYKANGNLSFGDALHYVKAGSRVTRRGWNGKGMWIVLISGINFTTDLGEFQQYPYLAMKPAGDSNHLVPWTISQTDALMSDWEVLSE